SRQPAPERGRAAALDKTGFVKRGTGEREDGLMDRLGDVRREIRVEKSRLVLQRLARHLDADESLADHRGALEAVSLVALREVVGVAEIIVLFHDLFALLD